MSVFYFVKAVMPHVHDLHANGTGHELDHEIHVHDAFSQKRAVWCGLTALAGILLFFIVERLVGFCSERRRVKNDPEVFQCSLMILSYY